jgi:hypothetical protein
MCIPLENSLARRCGVGLAEEEQRIQGMFEVRKPSIC